MLAEAALRRSGRVTGLYTSPHLCEFSERIRICGVPADASLLEECAQAVLPAAEREDATFFESATVLAFEAFRRAGCETVVLEVGLGGRLDATNVVQPGVAVITSVDMDHSDYLGDTLAQIALEKAGILKAGVPAVVGPLKREPTEIVRARAAELGAPLDEFGRDLAVEHVSVGVDGTRFRYLSDGWADGLQVRTRLVGQHQARNRDDVASGMSAAHLPGRFETLTRRGRSWVLDIAHNPAAIRVLADLVDALPLPRPVVFLVGILGDKPWAAMLDPLLAAGSGVVLTVAPSSPEERRWKLEDVVRMTAGMAAEGESDFARAMTRARELASEGTVIVTGSAHTVGDARSLILIDADES
jgi:dihydrofolate synthase/folylpolyglutamate synthase